MNWTKIQSAISELEAEKRDKESTEEANQVFQEIGIEIM